MEALEYITNYYNNYDEDGRLLSKHGQVEFLTTMRYIEKYLTQDARVLEIGAGTGRYSLSLAQDGYSIDADETFEMYLRYHFSICERADLVGATHHSLDIVQKN